MEVHQLASLGVHLADSSEGGVIVQNRVESSLVVEVKEKEYDDPLLVQLKEGIHKHKTMAFPLETDDSTLRYQGRLCVSNIDEEYSGLCGKMSKLSTNEAEHQSPGEVAQDLEISLWKWELIYVDFVTDRQSEQTIQTLEYILCACVVDLKGSWDDHFPLIEFAYNNSYHSSNQMALFKALYGKRCRTPIGWFEIGEEELKGPYLMHQAMEKVKIIKERLKTAQSCQKSYSDMRRRDLEFKKDDWVFLKVSPMNGIM
ncbi:uncharacterized protein [Nicotiana tomentosiformis]|uniref:uncharacterized protein n=1 Tax=Nicotiana tomentosiformis TaxID=4098 RepID=UPI00388C6322